MREARYLLIVLTVHTNPVEACPHGTSHLAGSYFCTIITIGLTIICFTLFCLPLLCFCIKVCIDTIRTNVDSAEPTGRVCKVKPTARLSRSSISHTTVVARPLWPTPTPFSWNHSVSVQSTAYKSGVSAPAVGRRTSPSCHQPKLPFHGSRPTDCGSLSSARTYARPGQQFCVA